MGAGSVSTQKKLLIAGGVALLIGVLVLVLRPHTKEAPASASGPAVVWEYFSDHNSIGGLALGNDGTIYAGTAGSVIALGADGALRWSAPANSPRLVVVGSDGKAYAAGVYGLIFGFSNDGKMEWNPRYGLIGFSVPPAVGDGGTLYYVNTIGDIYAWQPHAEAHSWMLGTVRAGIMNASYLLPGTSRADGSNRAPAVIQASGMIVVPRSHWLQEFSAEGHQAWTLELTSGHLGAAALGKDGTIYVGDDQNMLFAVDRSGEKLWQFETYGSVIGSPVVDADGIIYFNAPRAIYALKPDGALKWQARTTHDCRTSPTLAADGTLYIGAADGMNAFNSDGTEKWWLRMKMIDAPVTIGADGTIYTECGIFWVCAVKDSGSPLMQSPWPKWQHDPANTGRVTTLF